MFTALTHLFAHCLPRIIPQAITLVLATAGTASASAAMSFQPDDPLVLARRHYQEAMQLRSEGRQEAADAGFLRAQRYYRQVPDWNMVVNCDIYRSQLNYDLGRQDSLARILDGAQLVLNREALKEEHFKQERVYYFRALHLEAVARYQEAADFLDRAVTILQAVEKPVALDSAYLSSHKTLSGSIYYDRRDHETAVSHYLAALSLFPASRPDQAKLLNIYNNLGLALLEQGQVAEGMSFLKKSLAILPGLQPEDNSDDFLQTYFNLARGYLLLGQTPAAIRYLDLASSLLRYQPADRHYWLSLWAQAKEQQQQWESALASYGNALDARKAARGDHHPSVAKLHQDRARVALKLQRTDAALSAIQEGLHALDGHFDTSDVFQAPAVANISDLYLLIQLLKAKGDLLQTRFPDEPILILPTYRTAIQAIDRLRQVYESDASKLLLSREAKAIFAAAVSLLYQQHRRRPEAGYLEEAFQYMEKSKSLLLLENIRKWRNVRLSRQRQADDFSHLLEEEKNAKLDLILLQRKMGDAQAETGPADGQKRMALEKAYQEVNARYTSIKARLSERFPQYYAASYEDSVATVVGVRARLLKNPQTALIAYFISEGESYAMLVGRDTVVWEKLSAPEQWLDDFHQYQQALRTQGARVLEEQTFRQYVRSASLLYDQLLRPLLGQYPGRYRHLYLVPDDILGFLAFESFLISQPVAAATGYTLAEQDYLIEHTALAYGYSATLLAEGLDQRPAGQDQRADYAGFAPVFKDRATGQATSRDCTTGNLMYLPYSEEGIRQAGALHRGTTFIRQAATLANFRSAAGRYRILQLSTHACVDQQDALFNVLYFYDTTLATYEIFDIPLQADLVILSACETGHGDLLQGEGIMSLSRGFYYAGSANIVTSLWPADDHATKELMLRLNHYLRKGLLKDEALRQAKLDYLQAQGLRPAAYAPALWANFILIGNQKKIDTGAGNWKKWLLPVLALGTLLAATWFFVAHRP